MSNEVAIIDTDTRIGALRREAHWTLVVAATGGGLTFTWLAHVLQHTSLAFAVHGVAGVVGGYLVGTGIARAVTGVRARPLQRRYEIVSTGNRIVASGLRVGVGAAAFYASYLFAIGAHTAGTFVLEPWMLGTILPFGIWGLLIAFAVIRQLGRAMR